MKEIIEPGQTSSKEIKITSHAAEALKAVIALEAEAAAAADTTKAKPFEQKASGITVDRRENLTRKELINEYVLKNLPVIDADGAKKWPAYGKFTPDFFKKNYGQLTKEVKGKTYTIAEFIDLMLKSSPENPAPYPFNLNIEEYFPDLMNDIKPELLYAKSDRVNHPLLPKAMLKGTEVYEMFFGGNGSFFPFLHIDALYLHTQITQIYGDKEFILYPPEQSAYMYPREDNPKISHVNIFNPDYDKFPLFKKAEPIRITVKQGETLFFPTGWWHATKIHGPCISVGRIQLNAGNWNNFVDDNYKLWKEYHPKVAGFARFYAKTLGSLMNLLEKFV